MGRGVIGSWSDITSCSLGLEGTYCTYFLLVASRYIRMLTRCASCMLGKVRRGSALVYFISPSADEDEDGARLAGQTAHRGSTLCVSMCERSRDTTYSINNRIFGTPGTKIP